MNYYTPPHFEKEVFAIGRVLEKITIMATLQTVIMIIKYCIFSISSHRPGPEVIKLFSCSTQLSTKFILLINVIMPTIVGILTFISMINTTSE